VPISQSQDHVDLSAHLQILITQMPKKACFLRYIQGIAECRLGDMIVSLKEEFAVGKLQLLYKCESLFRQLASALRSMGLY
jgi:hypothetical protein